MKRFFLFSLSLAYTLIAQNLSAQAIDRVLAVIGNEMVLFSEVEGQYKMLLSQSKGQMPPGARCMLFDQALVQALMINQAEKDSLKVEPDEINRQIDARITQILAMMGNDEKQFKNYYGRTVQQVRNDMQDDMRRQIMAQRMQAKITQSVQVTPKEVKEFFGRIPVDSLPYQNSEVELGQIVLKAKPSAKAEEEAQKKAEDLRKRLVNENADFAQLASTYSDDPGSRRLGGDLGTVPRGSFVPEYEAAAYQLSKGEISEVVKSPFGYHVIQLIARYGNSVHTRHILITPQITSDDHDRARQRLDSIRTLILLDSMTFDQAVQRFSEDDYSKTRNGELSNPMTGEGVWELADLDPSVYFAIEKLKVGEMTEPIENISPRNEVSYALYKIRQRSTPHITSLGEDYAKIQMAALEEKKMKALDDWVKLKVSEFYVELKPGWKEALQVKSEDGFCKALERWMVKRP